MRNINTGEFEFGGVTHYWVEVDRDVIIESPNDKTITVAKREGGRYRLHQGAGKGKGANAGCHRSAGPIAKGGCRWVFGQK